MSRFNLQPMMLFLSLTTFPNDWSARAYRDNDGAPSHDPLVVEDDTLDTGKIGIDLILPQVLNHTAAGKPRGPRRSLPRSLLQSRQQNAACAQPQFVYVCPVTEHDPCCDPAFPICCHDPSDICCPAGYFCSGLSTCCREGSIGCGDGCCVNGQTCGLVNNTPTCVSGAANPIPSSTAPVSSATVGGQTASNPSAANSTAPNNTPIIAGAIGGGVVAIILISLLAWCILRNKASALSSPPANTGVNTNSPSPIAARSLMANNDGASPSNGFTFPPGAMIPGTLTHQRAVGPGGNGGARYYTQPPINEV